MAAGDMTAFMREHADDLVRRRPVGERAEEERGAHKQRNRTLPYGARPVGGPHFSRAARPASSSVPAHGRGPAFVRDCRPWQGKLGAGGNRVNAAPITKQ